MKKVLSLILAIAMLMTLCVGFGGSAEAKNLLPLDEEGNNDDGEVWFYRYFEDESDPNSEPQLEYIDDDDEYENVADAFDEYLDNVEFDEVVKEEE